MNASSPERGGTEGSGGSLFTPEIKKRNESKARGWIHTLQSHQTHQRASLTWHASKHAADRPTCASAVDSGYAELDWL